jgi:putative signal transducing protein
MVKFYDPRDAADLARVEAILREGGIEYFLNREPEAGIGPMQVHVAEEDFPHAEKLLRKEELKKEPTR